ncbi:hypothetical protein L1987_85355 [Smallanthus sonchifolius]|uniref:Uncharacterized protein n=1 Tax=Smallanthus sonchifolius TaxID=185202 RepID=A0ACB8XW84_9ASTR|nr:hypothetical protein L1987_85355 [Smallanthus sonchifolius]
MIRRQIFVMTDKRKNKLENLFAYLGPGFHVSIAYIDPGRLEYDCGFFTSFWTPKMVKLSLPRGAQNIPKSWRIYEKAKTNNLMSVKEKKIDYCLAL